MRVALIGMGFYAPRHLEAWCRISGAELIAIVDPQVDRARQAAQAIASVQAFASVADMLASCRPDLVDIVTPPSTHPALVADLAGYVPAIVCQKPLAPTLAQAEQMVALAEGMGTALYVHENFRFQPWFQQTRRILDTGALGPPCQLSFQFRPGDGRGPKAYLDRQPYFREALRFFVHETGIHYIDTFRYLLGEVRAVMAQLRRVNTAIAGEDAALVLFEFESGAVGVLDANRNLDHPAQDPRMTNGQMLLECENGSLRLDGHGQLWQRMRGQAQESLAWHGAPGEGNTSVQAFQSQLLAILGGQAARDDLSARAYLRNMQIEEAVYAAAQEGRRVLV